MSESHLSNLKNALEARSWQIVDEQDGNDYDISGVWVIARPDGTSRLHILFQGLDDMNTLPLERAYGCRLRELPHVGLSFARISRSWRPQLDKFIDSLDTVDRSEKSSP